MTGSVSFRQLKPFGVEVDVDLSVSGDAELYGTLRRLYAEHHLLLFRRQNLSMKDQIRFGKQFGPVESTDGLSLGTYVSNCRKDGNFGLEDVNGPLGFHHDGSFTPHPARAIIFHAIDVVDRASSTRVCSGALAYDRLPQATKARLKGLQVLSVWIVDPARRNRNREVPPSFPRTVHPVLWRHEVTGRPFLHLCSTSTDSILGLPEAESEELLQELWSNYFAEDVIYEHFWEQGDLLMIDNWALQHGRGHTGTAGNRTLQRVTLSDKSFADIYPEMDMTAILGTDGKDGIGLAEGWRKDTFTN